MRALLSVSDKQGISKLGLGLMDLGWEIISTGGTRRNLVESGINATELLLRLYLLSFYTDIVGHSRDFSVLGRFGRIYRSFLGCSDRPVNGKIIG